ncbi:MAG: PD40 domain-containing protein [Chloroflexi bacterium]|nr:PD40 domain-containing protein [Chloroflexota bacterium]
MIEMRLRVAARAAVLAGLALTVVLSSCQMLNHSNVANGAQGKITWPKDGDLWVYDLATRQQTKITNLSSGAAVTGATWSPDGTRVIYAQFWRRPNERSSGADLMIANADGSDARPFAERDAPNTVLETPEWMPSGNVYFTIRRVVDGKETQTIVRQMEGGQPETVLDNAYDPAASPDESTLVYVRSTRTGQELMKKSMADSDDGCELLSDQVFQYLSLPRISPDGKRVALGGSGEPNMGPSGCGGDPHSSTPAAAGGPGIDVGALLQPDTAYAHGLPADVWSMNLDGSDMKRIADIKDDDPTVAFSPDGGRMAIFGVAALFMVDASGGPTDKLTDQGGYGGLDWTAR